MSSIDKPIVKPKTFSAMDMWKYHISKLQKENDKLKTKSENGVAKCKLVDENGNVVADYKTFKKVIALHNIKCATKLIHGYTINLNSGLGYLFVARIERSLTAKPRLNRGESFKLRAKLKAEGTLTEDNWRIYYNDDDYIKLKWFRPSYNRARDTRMQNIIFYKFLPAGGQSAKGFRQTLSREVRTNPSLKALYPFIKNNK